MTAALPRLAWLTGVAMLAACYEPAFEPCAVRCAHGVPCPDGMTCGPDLNCHASADEPACPPSLLTLTILKTGSGILDGFVIDDSGALDCGDRCTRTVLEGTKVTLYDDSNDGARLTAWFGVDGCAGPDPCTILVNDDLEIEAEFIRRYPVSVTFSGPGFGRVTSVPDEIDCTSDVTDCVGWFDEASTVTLTALPDSIFGGWSLGACGTRPTCTFTADAPVQLDATFE